MGVIHMQMYGSKTRKHDGCDASSGNTKLSLRKSNKLSKKFEHKRHLHQCTSPGGRPPRHPDSSLSDSTPSSFDKSNNTNTHTRTTTIDDYINEQFPADIIAKLKAESDCDVTDASTVLTNETFRMILGTDEEESDGIVLKEIDEEDEEPRLWFHFECLDIWR